MAGGLCVLSCHLIRDVIYICEVVLTLNLYVVFFLETIGNLHRL